MNRRPLPSLKGQALALLARREHSRAELRTKLLAHARKRAEAAAAATAPAAALPTDPWELPPVAAGTGTRSDLVHDRALDRALDRGPDHDTGFDTGFDAEAAAAEVDALLDELEAARHLSDARFAESRVHARAARQGTARIRQELARHGVTLDAETARQLRESEAERARAVWQRKFGGRLPADAAERARQARFLAARGFAAEVVHRLLGGRDDD